MNLIGVGVVQSEVDFFDVYGHIVVVVGLHIHSPRVSVAVLLPLLTEVTRLGKKKSGGQRCVLKRTRGQTETVPENKGPSSRCEADG